MSGHSEKWPRIQLVGVARHTLMGHPLLRNHVSPQEEGAALAGDANPPPHRIAQGQMSRKESVIFQVIVESDGGCLMVLGFQYDLPLA